MRQCKCGGIVRNYDLTGQREVWTCAQCKRFQITARNQQPPTPQPKAVA